MGISPQFLASADPSETGGYFEFDVLDYVPAFGKPGLTKYRRELEARERAPTVPYSRWPQEWSSDSERHARRVRLSNAHRFRVLERNEEAFS